MLIFKEKVVQEFIDIKCDRCEKFMGTSYSNIITLHLTPKPEGKSDLRRYDLCYSCYRRVMEEIEINGKHRPDVGNIYT